MRRSRSASRVRRRGKEISRDLSQNCRCKCSSVCTITGPDTVPAGKTKTYRLEIDIARNRGCVATTGACEHASTAWTKGGQRGARVTLKDKKKVSVKVKVAQGTPAGKFTLRATPVTTCECKGPKNIVRDCDDQFDGVTINVS